MKIADLVKYENNITCRNKPLKFGLILKIYHPFYKILWSGGIISKYIHYTRVKVINEI